MQIIQSQKCYPLSYIHFYNEVTWTMRHRIMNTKCVPSDFYAIANQEDFIMFIDVYNYNAQTRQLPCICGKLV